MYPLSPFGPGGNGAVHAPARAPGSVHVHGFEPTAARYPRQNPRGYSLPESGDRRRHCGQQSAWPSADRDPLDFDPGGPRRDHRCL